MDIYQDVHIKLPFCITSIAIIGYSCVPLFPHRMQHFGLSADRGESVAGSSSLHLMTNLKLWPEVKSKWAAKACVVLLLMEIKF